MTFTDDEIRILGLCAPTVLRMLKAKEEKIIARMYGDFRNGKSDYSSVVAELACMRDLQHEIQSALARHEKGNE
jgi:hypothetical protein